MADDPTKCAPQDASRISLKEDHEVRYWTQELGVTKERLEQLVQDHGHSVAAIRKTLGR
jgi:hypothetical protein